MNLEIISTNTWYDAMISLLFKNSTLLFTLILIQQLAYLQLIVKVAQSQSELFNLTNQFFMT